MLGDFINWYNYEWQKYVFNQQVVLGIAKKIMLLHSEFSSTPLVRSQATEYWKQNFFGLFIKISLKNL